MRNAVDTIPWPKEKPPQPVTEIMRECGSPYRTGSLPSSKTTNPDTMRLKRLCPIEAQTVKDGLWVPTA